MTRRAFETRSPDSSKTGSALVLVLVLVCVVGMIAAASITFAQTSMSGSILYQSKRASLAGAEGSIRTAIQYVKANPSTYADLGTTTKNGVTVQQCVSPALTDSSMNVKICPNAGSGASSGIPRAAIISLSTSSSEDGINKGSSGTMLVNGGVFSNTTLKAKGTIKVAGANVYSRGACDSGNITVDTGYTVNCNYGSAANAIGDDPNFDPPITAPPAAAVLPATCTGSTTSVTLSPGTYTSAAALNAITTKCARTILSPGVYYMNFPSNDATWQISKNGTSVIGGTIADATKFPGGCDPTSANGVALVFGGYSRLDQNGGTVELCAPVGAANSPQIAIYGVKTGTAGTLTPQAGCIVTVNSCSFLTNQGSGVGLAVNGTVYLPAVSLNLQMTNISNQIVTRGLVIRSVAMQITGSSTFTGYAFGIPGTIFGTGDGDIVLTAYTDRAWISARVKFPQSGAPTIVTWVSCTADADTQENCKLYTPL